VYYIINIYVNLFKIRTINQILSHPVPGMFISSIQVRLSNKTEITAVFDVRGLVDAIKQYNNILGLIE